MFKLVLRMTRYIEKGLEAKESLTSLRNRKGVEHSHKEGLGRTQRAQLRTGLAENFGFCRKSSRETVVLSGERHDGCVGSITLAVVP